MNNINLIEKIGRKAKIASSKLLNIDADTKNNALKKALVRFYPEFPACSPLPAARRRRGGSFHPAF